MKGQFFTEFDLVLARDGLERKRRHLQSIYAQPKSHITCQSKLDWMPAERALGIIQHSATRCGAGMLTPIYPTTYLPLFEHARCNNWPRGYVQCLLRSSFQLILTAFITLAWMQGQYTVCTLVPMLESIESPWGSADAVAWAGFISAGLTEI